MSLRTIITAAILIGYSCVSAWAGEANRPKSGGDTGADSQQAPSAAGPSLAASETTDLDKLIEQLDSSKFTEREEASRKLAHAGKTAIPALTKAASSESLEVASRAVQLLGKLLNASDETAKTAAKDALETIAKSDSQAAAGRAKALLEPLAPPPPANSPFFRNNGMGMGRIVINGGTLVLGGGTMKKISVSNNNGVREINASEDGKSVKIVDDPQNGIKVELTQKKNGKEVIDKFEAKNADELKKKSPEAFKAYEQYAKNNTVAGANANGMFQFQVQQALQLPAGGPLPMAIPAIPFQPAILPAPALKPAAVPPATGNTQADVTSLMMKTLTEQIDLLAKNSDACKDATPASKEALKKQIEELRRRLHDLEQQLDKG